MKSRIYITESDFEQLDAMIDHKRAVCGADAGYLEMLERELDRAEIVDSRVIPRDVVTMNSEVRLRDLDSGEERVYRLVFPGRSGAANSVSVLAPIGTAMLGYRVGDVIEWPVPKGLRRLKVVKVLYQPEAAGACGN